MIVLKRVVDDDLIIDSSSLFDNLRQSLTFEHVGKGRDIAIAVDAPSANAIPIVRTTTVYQESAQMFPDCIHRIVESLRRASGSDSAQSPSVSALNFNNAMIELYSCEYRKMGFHCDQMLDLQANSFIAIFSLYSGPDVPLRKLVVQRKLNDSADAAQSLRDVEEIVLEHNSAVLFSLDTNRRMLHKIVLANSNAAADNDALWMGVTLRLSKTFVDPLAPQVRLADETERREFLRLRAQENREIDFQYPATVDFTISPSDLLPLAP
jgi:hypothetical protein